MPLTVYHKHIISETLALAPLFSREVEGGEQAIAEHVRAATSAIEGPAAGHFERFKRLFDDPQAFPHISEQGRVTNGEIRQQMVVYLDKMITDAAPHFGKTVAELGWDKEAQLSAVYRREGKEIGLGQAQIDVPNFGEHTLLGIWKLQEDEKMSTQAAYFRVAKLNKFQVAATWEYGFSREQVNIPHFGKHTMDAMDILISRSLLKSAKGAYEQVKGLDAHRVAGIVDYQLSREEVEAPNFGAHTLSAIKVLSDLAPKVAIDHDRGICYEISIETLYQDAYKQVRGYDAEQVSRVVSAAHREAAQQQVQVGAFNVPARGQRIGPQVHHIAR